MMIGKEPVSLRSGSYADKLGGFGEYLRLVRDVPAVGTTLFLRLVGQVPKGGTRHTKEGYKFGIGISFKSWAV